MTKGYIYCSSRAEGQGTSWTGHQSVTGQTPRQTTIHTHIHTLTLSALHWIVRENWIIQRRLAKKKRTWGSNSSKMLIFIIILACQIIFKLVKIRVRKSSCNVLLVNAIFVLFLLNPSLTSWWLNFRSTVEMYRSNTHGPDSVYIYPLH